MGRRILRTWRKDANHLIERASGGEFLAEEDIPVLRCRFEELGFGAQSGGGFAKSISQLLFAEVGDKRVQISAILPAGAEELAYKDVIWINGKDLKISERPDRPESPIPAGRELVRMKMGEPKSMKIRKLVQKLMLLANHRGNFIDNVNVLGPARQSTREDQRNRPTDDDLRGLRNAQRKLTKEAVNRFGLNSIHDAPLERWESDLVRILLKVIRISGALDGLASGGSAQPLVETLISPVAPERAHGIAHEQPRAIVQRRYVSNRRLNRARQRISINKRPINSQAPKLIHCPVHMNWIIRSRQTIRMTQCAFDITG
jgi:hypothetical protein